MSIDLYWSDDVVRKFPGLAVAIGNITNVSVEKENNKIRELKESVCKEVLSKYSLDTLKDNPIVRAYRDLYWRIGIDPTKTRPSGEALLRRVLRGNPVPTLLTAVDAYNLASIKTIIPISGFDMARLHPPLNIRFARKDEEFIGIGATKPIKLDERMLVLTDSERVLCIYPHRDSEHTKITEDTKEILIVAYGAQGIGRQQLEDAVQLALKYINTVCGGEIGFIRFFSSVPAGV
ncbi:MAG: phenylalanine--tRNA ligase beta subunit-related protein [Candidatus Bathyarchaeia archaeon]